MSDASQYISLTPSIESVLSVIRCAGAVVLFVSAGYGSMAFVRFVVRKMHRKVIKYE
jgi:hypothetical protein